MPNTLDWSHAFTGRMQPSATEKFRRRAAELSGRLRAEINSGILPFLSMPYRARLEADLAPLEEPLRRFRHMVLLGIGGSALGPRAIQRAFAPGQDGPNHDGRSLWIVDNVCAASLDNLLEKLDPAETVVVCTSKSGGTIETLSQYFLVKEWLTAALGSKWTEHMVFVTDAAKGFLREEADRTGVPSLEVPDYLGGRYSALSAVGCVPAAFLGIDWRALLDGAARVAEPLVKAAAVSDEAMEQALAAHPSFELAAWARALEEEGYSELIFFCYMPMWATFAPWFAQLWAESLGKQGRGTMPVSATGVTDQHSVNQMFLDGPRNKACLFVSCADLPKGRVFPQDLPERWSYLRGRSFGDLLEAEGMGTRMALVRSQVPLVGIRPEAPSEAAAGSMMLLLEAATVLTGWLLDINPIDQPAVELGKRLANARLGAAGYDEEQRALSDFLNAAEDIREY